MVKSVLIVEDNPDEAFMIKRATAKSSVPVDAIIAGSGEDAVKLLFHETSSPLTPNLIILDLKLPGMSGFDVLRKIKSSNDTSFIPVIILSSSELMEDRIEAYGAGAISFIRKPLGFIELIATMDLIIRYWLVLNHPLIAYS